jgi:hypothetical protein
LRLGPWRMLASVGRFRSATLLHRLLHLAGTVFGGSFRPEAKQPLGRASSSRVADRIIHVVLAGPPLAQAMAADADLVLEGAV